METEPTLKKKPMMGPPIPEDYIWDRGRVDKVMDFAEESIAPPPGYNNLNLYSQERLPHFKNMNPTNYGQTDYIQRIDQYPWPFPDDSVMKINIGAAICQLGNLELFMAECWRVMTKAGILRIKAPYYTHQNYIGNTRNILPICDLTFSYFNYPWLKKTGVVYQPKSDFDTVQRVFYYENDFELLGNIAKEYARAHYWNIVFAVEFILSAVKPMRIENA